MFLEFPIERPNSHFLEKWHAPSGLFPLMAMPILQIGQTTSPYTVRYNSRTKRQRIVVTPEAIEV